MTSGETDHFIPLIVERLKPIDPARVILFGSRAHGTASDQSDLDLLVVTRSDEMPGSYQEKTNVYLEVARALREIRRQTPIDLIVHTRAMHARFIELDSAFAREIVQNGVVVYESHHA